MVKTFVFLLFFGTALSAQADPLKTLSKKIASELKSKPVSLGVLNFYYERGKMSTGSYLVSERLLTYLVQDGLPVVERRLIESLLTEQRFAQIGITNIDSLKRIGNFLGVDAVVVGTLSDSKNETDTDILARVIDVESARVIAGGSAATALDWPDAPKPPAASRARVAVPDVSLARPPQGAVADPTIRRERKKTARTLGQDHYNPPLVPAFFSLSADGLSKRGNTP